MPRAAAQPQQRGVLGLSWCGYLCLGSAAQVHRTGQPVNSRGLQREADGFTVWKVMKLLLKS